MHQIDKEPWRFRFTLIVGTFLSVTVAAILTLVNVSVPPYPHEIRWFWDVIAPVSLFSAFGFGYGFILENCIRIFGNR